MKRDNKGKNTTLTLHEFLETLPEDYKSKYDYSETIYTGGKNPISFVCPVHGKQTETVRYHKDSRTGCKLCGKDLQEKLRVIKNKKEFIEFAEVFHNKKYDYRNVVYTKSINLVTITCPIHGDFTQTPANHRGSGCEDCGKISTALKLSKPYEDVVRECTDKFGDRFTYDKNTYISSSKPFDGFCKEHGRFPITLHSFLASTEGCPSCFKDKPVIPCNIIKQVDNVEELRSLYGDTYNFFTEDIYRGRDKVRYYCKTHHILHSTQLRHLREGHACPRCGSDKGSLKLSGFYNTTVIERKKEFFKKDFNQMYFIHLEDDKYKIGLAKDISTRISSIKHKLPLHPKVITSIKGNTYDLFYHEQSILEKYNEFKYVYPKPKRFKGYTEVLQLTEEQVLEIRKEYC